MFFLLMCASTLFYCFLINFHFKLISLLCLESLMVISIGLFFLFYEVSAGVFSQSISPLLMIMMVLDSLLGISLLILSSRSNSSFQIYC